MSKTINRVLVVAILFVAVLWLWTLVARTGWEATDSLDTAGPNYDTVFLPLYDVAYSVFAAVVAVVYTRHIWRWYATKGRNLQPEPAELQPVGAVVE